MRMIERINFAFMFYFLGKLVPPFDDAMLVMTFTFPVSNNENGHNRKVESRSRFKLLCHYAQPLS